MRVYVEDDNAGIPDVEVTITNGKQAWTKTTDAEGFAEFTVPEPGKYTISAQKRFYALDPEMKSDLEVEVLVGSCSGGRVTLRAQGEVVGSVQNAQTTPVSGLHLQLLSVSDSKREDLGDIGTLPKRMQQVSFTFSRYLLDVTTSEQTFVSFRHTRTSCALSILAFAKKRMPRLSKSNWISLKRA